MFVAHPEIMYKERPHADALCGIRCLKNGVDIPAARRREGRGEGEGEGEGQGDRERESEADRRQRERDFFCRQQWGAHVQGEAMGQLSWNKNWPSSMVVRGRKFRALRWIN